MRETTLITIVKAVQGALGYQTLGCFIFLTEYAITIWALMRI